MHTHHTHIHTPNITHIHIHNITHSHNTHTHTPSHTNHIHTHTHTHTHTHYRWPWDSEMQKLHKKDALCWKQFCNQISSMIPLFHPVTPMTALMLMKRETAVIRNKSSRIYSFRKISWQISAADPGPWGRNCGHWGKEGPTQHSLIRVLIQELWPSCISLREVPKMLDGTI
jgi:hypothetical protein